MLRLNTPSLIGPVSVGFVLASLPLAGQHLSVGMKAGVATLEPISVSGPFDRQLHPLIIGPVIEVALPHDLGIEVSALHRRITYRFKGPVINPTRVPPQVQEETKADSWELPLVLKRHVAVGSRWRPFGEIGLAIRHTSSTTHAYGYVYAPGGPFPFYRPVAFPEEEKTLELVKPWGEGLVVGVGQEIRIGFLRVQPELRYMRWLNAAFRTRSLPARPPGLQSNRNSLDFFIGVLFSR